MTLSQETIEALGQDERDAVLALLARIEALEAAQGNSADAEAETDAVTGFQMSLMVAIQNTSSTAERTALYNDIKGFIDARQP